jgi:hypothetical protein
MESPSGGLFIRWTPTSQPTSEAGPEYWCRDYGQRERLRLTVDTKADKYELDSDRISDGEHGHTE